jgi:cytochrome c-type biogenesis protein CcmH
LLAALAAVVTASAGGQPGLDSAAQGATATAPAAIGAAAAPLSDRSLDEAAILGPPAGPRLAGAALESRTSALGSRMRCPVCQGLSIADSPSASALAMLSQVRDLLARGYSEDQVLDYFVSAYGEFVLLQPTARGFNLVVWIAPLAAVAIGAGLIARRLRSARRAGAPPEQGGDGGDGDLDPYLERVRTELRS